MKARIIPKNKVICDDCSGEFDLKIEEVEIEPGIIEQFFECPYCGSHTTITITDPEPGEYAIQIGSPTATTNKNSMSFLTFGIK